MPPLSAKGVISMHPQSVRLTSPLTLHDQGIFNTTWHQTCHDNIQTLPILKVHKYEDQIDKPSSRAPTTLIKSPGGCWKRHRNEARFNGTFYTARYLSSLQGLGFGKALVRLKINLTYPTEAQLSWEASYCTIRKQLN